MRASKVNHKMFNEANGELSKPFERMNEEKSSKVEDKRVRGKSEHSQHAQAEICQHPKKHSERV